MSLFFQSIASYGKNVYYGFSRAAMFGPLSKPGEYTSAYAQVKLAALQISDFITTPFKPNGVDLFACRAKIICHSQRLTEKEEYDYYRGKSYFRRSYAQDDLLRKEDLVSSQLLTRISSSSHTSRIVFREFLLHIYPDIFNSLKTMDANSRDQFALAIIAHNKDLSEEFLWDLFDLDYRTYHLSSDELFSKCADSQYLSSISPETLLKIGLELRQECVIKFIHRFPLSRDFDLNGSSLNPKRASKFSQPLLMHVLETLDNISDELMAAILLSLDMKTSPLSEAIIHKIINNPAASAKTLFILARHLFSMQSSKDLHGLALDSFKMILEHQNVTETSLGLIIGYLGSDQDLDKIIMGFLKTILNNPEASETALGLIANHVDSPDILWQIVNHPRQNSAILNVCLRYWLAWDKDLLLTKRILTLPEIQEKHLIALLEKWPLGPGSLPASDILTIIYNHPQRTKTVLKLLCGKSDFNEALILDVLNDPDTDWEILKAIIENRGALILALIKTRQYSKATSMTYEALFYCSRDLNTRHEALESTVDNKEFWERLIARNGRDYRRELADVFSFPGCSEHLQNNIINSIFSSALYAHSKGLEVFSFLGTLKTGIGIPQALLRKVLGEQEYTALFQQLSETIGKQVQSLEDLLKIREIALSTKDNSTPYQPDFDFWRCTRTSNPLANILIFLLPSMRYTAFGSACERFSALLRDYKEDTSLNIYPVRYASRIILHYFKQYSPYQWEIEEFLTKFDPFGVRIERSYDDGHGPSMSSNDYSLSVDDIYPDGRYPTFSNSGGGGGTMSNPENALKTDGKILAEHGISDYEFHGSSVRNMGKDFKPGESDIDIKIKDESLPPGHITKPKDNKQDAPIAKEMEKATGIKADISRVAPDLMSNDKDKKGS